MHYDELLVGLPWKGKRMERGTSETIATVSSFDVVVGLLIQCAGI